LYFLRLKPSGRKFRIQKASDALTSSATALAVGPLVASRQQVRPWHGGNREDEHRDPDQLRGRGHDQPDQGEACERRSYQPALRTIGTFVLVLLPIAVVVCTILAIAIAQLPSRPQGDGPPARHATAATATVLTATSVVLATAVVLLRALRRRRFADKLVAPSVAPSVTRCQPRKQKA
jgi:hypothetical protein